MDDIDALVTGTDEGSFSAEGIRIRGQIAAGRDDLSDAICFFEKAIIVSKQQGALLFELRATTQLALSLARQGRLNEAARQLNETIGLFKAKHEMFDLVAARAALNTMS